MAINENRITNLKTRLDALTKKEYELGETLKAYEKDRKQPLEDFLQRNKNTRDHDLRSINKQYQASQINPKWLIGASVATGSSVYAGITSSILLPNCIIDCAVATGKDKNNQKVMLATPNESESQLPLTFANGNINYSYLNNKHVLPYYTMTNYSCDQLNASLVERGIKQTISSVSLINDQNQEINAATVHINNNICNADNATIAL